MTDIYRTISTRRTPQSQPAGGATVKNAAGGYVFEIDDIARLKRFLILGSSGSTYYVKAPELTRQNAEVVIRMAQSDPIRLVDIITEISVGGRAPKQDQAIFALAIAASLADDAGRAYALSKVSAVCRIGTHLYLFATYVKQFRGWGRGLKRAVGEWYTSKDVSKLAYQELKYRQRFGFQHRDLLRLARPNPGSPEREALHAYLMIKARGDHEPSARALDKFGDAARSPWSGKTVDYEKLPALVAAYEAVQDCSVSQAVTTITQHDLSWEMLPDKLLSEPEVWEALISKPRGLPQTALMRQLPRLTRLGLTTGATGKIIATQLQDAERLKAGRVHPINVLVAQRTYASGRSARGESTWTPTRQITDALDAAFYAAYGAVEPAGNRILLACDVSGSMGSAVSGLPLTCREAVAALCLVTLNTEQDAEIIGFSDGRGTRFGGYGWNSQAVADRLDISPRRRLDDVCSYMVGLNFGRTDCSLPMTWAQQNKLDFDAIWTLTDGETWYGQIHPHQALREYREFTGHNVRYGVVAMTATGTSIADPSDVSSLDIAGFDANVPAVISSFSAGRI
jgi:60 kDa SS-A/Ro ribonucleoprotein